MGRYAEASTAYREALRLNPYYLPARHNLVMYYLSVGNLVAAEREYLDHYRLDPKAAGRLKVFIDGMKGLSTK
jgi:Flp pilus assembly protein TadD